MKRSVCIITIIMMVMALVPSIVFADPGDHDQREEQVIPSDLLINPIYEDVINEDDLQFLDDFSDHDIYPDLASVEDDDEDEYSSDMDDAADLLREQMKYRISNPIVLLMIRNGRDADIGKLSSDIFSAAMEHTGEPTEGDYLGYVWQGMKCQMSYFFVGSTVFVTFKYNISYYTNANQEYKVDKAIDKLKTELDVSDKSDYEKIKAIYDYMTSNIEYDYKHLNDNSYKLKHSAYAALIDKTAVCQGYAVLFYRLALEYGIDTRVITGKSQGENHGWNIVKLGDKYYNVDATWDAGSKEQQYFLRGYKNFTNHESDGSFKETSFTKTYPIAESDYLKSDIDEEPDPEEDEDLDTPEDDFVVQVYPVKAHIGKSSEILFESAYDETIKSDDNENVSVSLISKTEKDTDGSEQKKYVYKLKITYNKAGNYKFSLISSKTGKFLEIDANVSDHEIVNDEPEQAGIDKMGQTAGQHCGICQKVFVEQTDIPALVKPAVIEKTYTGKYMTPKVYIKDTTGKTIKTVTMSKGKSVGTYSKTVTLSGNYFGKVKVSYKINPKGTSISSLAKVKKGFTVKWKKQTGKMATSRITGYQYRYSTSSKMTNATIKTVKGYGKTSAKKTGLKAKKTYYVQVRTYKTVNGVKYYSPWSKYKKVKTK